MPEYFDSTSHTPSRTKVVKGYRRGGKVGKCSYTKKKKKKKK